MNEARNRLRIWLLLPLAIVLCAQGGCAELRQALGFSGDYLLVANDSLVVPGQAATIQARLRKGNFFLDQDSVGVYFFRDGHVYDIIKTDHEGEVCVTFTPTRAGTYAFDVESYPVNRKTMESLKARAVVYCREPNTPLFVVDIDDTLTVTAPKRLVVEGDPVPMPRSAEVLQRIAKTHTVVYLTQRSDYLSARTKDWLSRHGYPAGPVLMPRLKQIFQGNEKFKAAVACELTRHFTCLGSGIGDKASDIEAYTAAGLQGIQIIQIPEDVAPSAMRDIYARLQSLPTSAQAVTGWDQVEKIVFDNATFPAAQTEADIRKLIQSREKTTP